jgi:translation initiation factor 2 subunit 3
METYNLNIRKKQFTIGTLGTVAAGKTTAIEQITGEDTRKHTNEKKQGFTINIGFSYAIIGETEEGIYSSNKIIPEFKKILTHFSFVDCPGHGDLIRSTLATSQIMDAVIVVIAINEDIRPQLIQHLLAIKIQNISDIIVCINKIDLLRDIREIKKKQIEIEEIFNKIGLKPHSYIPTCLSMGLGLEDLLNDIVKYFDKDYNNKNKSETFKILRSFDTNKSGINYKEVNYGVIGGTVMNGIFNINTEYEIRPGYISKDKKKYQPLKTIINSIESNRVDITDQGAKPGGLIGLCTNHDPTLFRNNSLVGYVLGKKENLGEVYEEITLNITNDKKFNKIFREWKAKMNEDIMLLINFKIINSKIIQIKRNKITFKLDTPVCINLKDTIILFNEILNSIEPIGIGTTVSGKSLINIYQE